MKYLGISLMKYVKIFMMKITKSCKKVILKNSVHLETDTMFMVEDPLWLNVIFFLNDLLGLIPIKSQQISS